MNLRAKSYLVMWGFLGLVGCGGATTSGDLFPDGGMGNRDASINSGAGGLATGTGGPGAGTGGPGTGAGGAGMGTGGSSGPSCGATGPPWAGGSDCCSQPGDPTARRRGPPVAGG